MVNALGYRMSPEDPDMLLAAGARTIARGRAFDVLFAAVLDLPSVRRRGADLDEAVEGAAAALKAWRAA